MGNKLINAAQNCSSHFFVNLHPQLQAAGTQESLEEAVNINTNLIPGISKVIVQLPDSADLSRLLHTSAAPSFTNTSGL